MITRGLAMFGAAEAAQAGALCWRRGKSGVEILLVTTRRTGRWITPKGGLIKDRTPMESAAIEAWEEAGVRGEISDEPLGVFPTIKFRKDGSSWDRLTVELFALRVTSQEEEFPEKGQRLLRWQAQEDAAGMVRERKLQRLIREFSPPPDET